MSRYGPGYESGGVQFSFPTLTRAVKLLIITNLAVQFLQLLLQGELAVWLGLSLLGFSNPPYLGPLNLFTYQFVHSWSGLGHVVFNMLALYFFGTMVEEHLGTRRFVRLYLACGVAGGLLWLLMSAVTGQPQTRVIGASGCVYGMIAYAAFLFPYARVFILIFPVRLWVVATALAVFAVYDTIVDLRIGASGVANSAHVGGMAFAAIWWRWGSLFSGLSRRLEAWRETRARKQRLADERELDRLLDKINQVGLGGLTAAERRWLTRHSKGRGS